MTLTTEQLRKRAAAYRTDAATLAELGDTESSQRLNESANAFDELAANREAQPVLCVDRDSDFIKHIQKCSEEVAKWPEWKRRGDDVTEFTAPPAPGVVKLPATRLWAGVIECYEKSDVIAALRAANVGVSDD